MTSEPFRPPFLSNLVPPPSVSFESPEEASGKWLASGLPELRNRSVKIVAGEGDVLEAAPQRIVVPYGGPVDSHGGVDGGFEIFRLDIAVARPAELGCVGPVVVRRADRSAAGNSRSGEYRELLRKMIPSLRGGQRPDGAAELSYHQDQRCVE